jgi:Rad3-related DNA helicase
LPDEAKQLLIPSPFDYANNAVLRLPRQACNPSEVEAHTDAVIEYIEQIDDKSGVLVLFSSRKQMREVHDNLSSALSELVLLQDDRSKQALLTEHKKRIDNGDRSFIFGLASHCCAVSACCSSKSAWHIVRSLCSLLSSRLLCTKTLAALPCTRESSVVSSAGQ